MQPKSVADTKNGIQATVPVLASLNLAQTLRFYSEHLCFAALLEMDNYLILQRDGCELHFWPCDDRHIAENTSCYARGDTRAMHADFTARGLQLAPTALQPGA